MAYLSSVPNPSPPPPPRPSCAPHLVGNLAPLPPPPPLDLSYGPRDDVSYGPRDDGRERGWIKSFDAEKGFGFIDCPKMREQFGRDVFLHKKQMGDLADGDEITFICEVNKDGKPQARDVLGVEAELGDGRERGFIKSFNAEKGFGFIDCAKLREQFGRDVFIHKNQMGDFAEGDEITFICEVNKDGKPQARDVLGVEAELGDGRERGFITRFNAEKGFGFIDCPKLREQFGRDVFVHKNQMGDFGEGDEITFICEVNKDGKPQARDVLGVEAEVSGGRERGHIKSFNEEKGFGFIDCPKMREQFGRDVFIHKNQMGDLTVGQEITFICDSNKDGKPQANMVEGVASDDGAGRERAHIKSPNDDKEVGSHLGREHGRIKSVNEEKGFGFIDCAKMKKQFGRDVFIHKSHMCDFVIGDEITFVCDTNKDGMPVAKDILPAHTPEHDMTDDEPENHDFEQARLPPMPKMKGTIAQTSTASRTTVMLRNLTPICSREELIQFLDEQGYISLYDFVYVAMCFSAKDPKSLGYGFVNFVTEDAADVFSSTFQGSTDEVFEGSGEISWSDRQGLQDNVESYRNSPIMHPSVQEICQPVIFEEGVRVSFPPPTKAIKAPRKRSGAKRELEQVAEQGDRSRSRKSP